MTDMFASLMERVDNVQEQKGNASTDMELSQELWVQEAISESILD